MATGTTYAAVTETRLFGTADLRDRLLGHLRELVQESFEKSFRGGCVYDSALSLVSGGNDAVTVSGSSLGTDGQGHLLDVATSGYASALQFENTAAVEYEVGLHYAEVPAGVQINPRSGQPEFIGYDEAIGESGTPDLVTDNGNGTITFRVNTITEAGVSNAGRKIQVWKNTPGPNATTETVAIEEPTCVWTGGNNQITTVAALGQDTVSTTAADYTVVLMGPTVKRNTTLYDVDGYAFLGKVTGGGAGSPPSGYNITDQDVINMSLSDLADITSRNATTDRLKVDVKSYTGDEGDPQIQVRNPAGTPVFTVDGDGNVTISGTTTQEDFVQVNASETITDNLTAGDDDATDSHKIKGSWWHTNNAETANYLKVDGSTGRIGINKAHDASWRVDISGNVRLDNVLQIASATPIQEYRETDIAVDAGGLWRSRVEAGDFVLDENTAAGGDFSTNSVWFKTDRANGALELYKHLWPVTDNTYDLGKSDQQWKDLYLDGVAYLDVLNLSTAASEGVGSDLFPTADGTYDLGGTGREWKDFYLDGVAYLDTLSISTVAGEGCATDFNPTGDNTLDLGSPSRQWANVYTVNLNVGADINPAADLTYDLGQPTVRWLNVYTQNVSGGADPLNLLGQVTFGATGSNGVGSVLKPTTNGAYTLGTSSSRWDTLYAEKTRLLYSDNTPSNTCMYVERHSATQTVQSLQVGRFYAQSDATIGDNFGGQFNYYLNSSAVAYFNWYRQDADDQCYLEFRLNSVADAADPQLTLQYDNIAKMRHLRPYVDGTYDLGSSGLEWQNLFVDGVAYIDTLLVSSAAGEGAYTLVPVSDGVQNLGSTSYRWQYLYGNIANLLVDTDTGSQYGLYVKHDATTLNNTRLSIARFNADCDATIVDNFGGSIELDTKDVTVAKMQWWRRGADDQCDLIWYLRDAADANIAQLKLKYDGGIETRTILPFADGTYDLGGSGIQFRDLYLHGIAYLDTISLSSTDGEGFSSVIKPTTSGTHNIGSTSRYWNIAYISRLEIGSTAPIVYWRETGVADDAGGLWRMVLDGGNWRLEENTAAGGDFSTNKYWIIFDRVNGWVQSGNHFLPRLNNTYDLGNNSYQWRNLYVDGTAQIDVLQLGIAASEGVTSHFYPTTDNTYDLGGSGREWRNLYVDGAAYIDVLALSTAGGEGVFSHLVPVNDGTQSLGGEYYRWGGLYGTWASMVYTNDTATTGQIYWYRQTSGNSTTYRQGYFGARTTAATMVDGFGGLWIWALDDASETNRDVAQMEWIRSGADNQCVLAWSLNNGAGTMRPQFSIQYNDQVRCRDIVPYSTDEWDLGSTTRRFQSAFFAGHVYFSSDFEFYALLSGLNPYINFDHASPNQDAFWYSRANNWFVWRIGGDDSVLLLSSTTATFGTNVVANTTGRELGSSGTYWNKVFASNHYVDSSFTMWIDGGNSRITWDTGDYMRYDRTNNGWLFGINNSSTVQLGGDADYKAYVNSGFGGTAGATDLRGELYHGKTKTNLSTTVNSRRRLLSLGASVSNEDYFTISLFRHTGGDGWSNSSIRLAREVDNAADVGGYIEFRQDVFRIKGDWLPSADNTYDLGTAALGWEQLYVNYIYKPTSGTYIEVLSDMRLQSSDLRTLGTCNIGTSTNRVATGYFGTINLNTADGSGVSTDFKPTISSSFDLGSSTRNWGDLWLGGTAHINRLAVATGVSLGCDDLDPVQDEIDDLGNATYAWDVAYIADIYSHQGLYSFDTYDDLALIDQFQPMAKAEPEVIERGGGARSMQRADPSTLPWPMLGPRCPQRQTWYLSVSDSIAFMLGAIKQLHQKHRAEVGNLQDQINGLAARLEALEA